MKKSILVLISLITLGLTSCSNQSKNENKIISVQENDNEMNTAINKARQNFAQFEKAFLENKETNKYSEFTIKEGFPTKSGGQEHMWISDLTFDGTDFRGILINEPQNETDVRYGDTITIDRNLISDWTYFDNSSKLTHGGYTMRVFVNRMSENEKAAFEQDNGIYFAPLAE